MDLQSLEALLRAVNAVTPLGLAVLLAVIIMLMTHKRGPIRKMQDNHLHHIEESLSRIADTGDKQLEAMNDVRADIAWVKGKLS